MPKLYTTSSGLGGAFTVRIIEEVGRGRVKVAVHLPRNPDWHGHTFETDRDRLVEKADDQPRMPRLREGSV